MKEAVLIRSRWRGFGTALFRPALAAAGGEQQHFSRHSRHPVRETRPGLRAGAGRLSRVESFWPPPHESHQPPGVPNRSRSRLVR